MNNFNGSQGALIQKKINKYLPVMIFTNLSTLLIVVVDGVVVGNLIGSTALAAVSVIAPVVQILSVMTALVASGFGISLSRALGTNDSSTIGSVCKAGIVLSCICTAITILIAFPMRHIMIDAYSASAQLKDAAMSYSTGVMFAAFFGVFSTCGFYVLVHLGKGKVILVLSIIEGLLNLACDLLFIGVLDMGIAGAGYGTLAANFVRMSLTIIYIYRNTNILKHLSASGKAFYKEMLANGINISLNCLMGSIQLYLVNFIILSFLGDDGMVVKAVCTFCLNISGMLAMSIVNTSSPLMGLFSGMNDRKAATQVLKKAIIASIIILGIFSILTALFPQLAYAINGVTTLIYYAKPAVIMVSISFVFTAFNYVFRCYINFYNRKKQVVLLSVLEGFVLITLFMLIFALLNPTWLFISYALSATITFIVAVPIVRSVEKDNSETDEDRMRIDVTVANAQTVSSDVHNHFIKMGYPQKIVNKVSLAVEEIAAYTIAAKADSTFEMYISISVQENQFVISTLDNGRGVFFHEILTTYTDLAWKNYDVLNAIADEISYQYVLDMNYFTITIKGESQ